MSLSRVASNTLSLELTAKLRKVVMRRWRDRTTSQLNSKTANLSKSKEGNSKSKVRRSSWSSQWSLWGTLVAMMSPVSPYRNLSRTQKEWFKSYLSHHLCILFMIIWRSKLKRRIRSLRLSKKAPPSPPRLTNTLTKSRNPANTKKGLTTTMLHG